MELKIMIHLGHHNNVLNLLGAVTKNIEKRKNHINLLLLPSIKLCPFVYNFNNF